MDNPLLQSLEWRLVGPHRGGRVVAVAGHPTERATFYFGACAGGVWKTTSGGAYWENCSDGFFNTAAVGAIAVAESDPNVIYVGTGEATNGRALAQRSGLTPATVSRHMTQLMRAGLVTGEVQGREMRYAVNQTALRNFGSQVLEVLGHDLDGAIRPRPGQ